MRKWLIISLLGWVMLPPVEYDRPYKGKLTVHYVDPIGMFFNCGIAGACAYMGGKWCTIYFPTWLKPKSAAFNIRMRHEKGHCNGWPPNHPNPRWVWINT